MMLFSIVHQIWPEIRKELPEAELHIYSSAGNNVKLNLTKKELEENKIFMKGYEEDL
jgi:hypothetical protein